MISNQTNHCCLILGKFYKRQRSNKSLYLNEHKQKLYLFSTEVDTFIIDSQVVFCFLEAIQRRHIHNVPSLCTRVLFTVFRKNSMGIPF